MGGKVWSLEKQSIDQVRVAEELVRLNFVCSYQSPVQATATLIQPSFAGNSPRSHAVLIKLQTAIKIQQYIKRCFC